MAELGEGSFGEPSSGSSEPSFVAQLGRISGKLLADNLQRDGVDIYVKNTANVADPHILHLDVNNMRVGIVNDSPAFDLDVNSQINTVNIESVDALFDGLVIATNQITTTVGNIEIAPTGDYPTALFDRMVSEFLIFDGNVISSINDQNIEFDPNASGTVELQSDTNVTGNLYVSGNISISGNLSKQGNIIIGDDVIDLEGNLPENDLVDFNAPFSQHLLPGLDNAYDLGGSLGDSTAGRWAQSWIPDWTNIVTLTTFSAVINNQMLIDGVNNEIKALQGNDNLVLNPDTGVLYVEELKFENSDITNLNTSTPVQFASTGAGYLRFMGTNAVLIPAGGDTSRPAIPELGDTRWNTDQQYLECFDGSVYVVSTGAGDAISLAEMEQLGNLYSLILG